MFKIIFCAIVMTTGVVQAQNALQNLQITSTPQQSQTDVNGWKTLSTVLISSSDRAVATKSCEDDSKVINLLSTDEVVFQAVCQESRNVKCSQYYCYELKVKVLVVK